MPDHPSDSKADSRTSSGLRTYLVGLIVIGLAVGYFSGMSESPVVATLLPLLFSLLGGSTGFFLAKADLTKPQSLARLQVLGLALLMFGAACVLASMYGVSVRTGVGLISFLPGWSGNPDSVYSVVSPGSSRTDVELALLDAKMARIGVSDPDRRAIVNKARAELFSEVGDKLDQQVAALKTHVDAVLASIGPTLEPLEAALEDDDSDDDALHPVLFDLMQYLRGASTLCDRLLTQTDKRQAGYVFAVLVERLSANVDNFPGQRPAFGDETSDVYIWLMRRYPSLSIDALLTYEGVVREMRTRYRTSDWIGDGELGRALDSYIATLDATPAQQPRLSIRP